MTGAIRLWCQAPLPAPAKAGGANRSCPVVNFSPVKQVNIKDRWYKPSIGPRASPMPAQPGARPPNQISIADMVNTDSAVSTVTMPAINPASPPSWRANT